MNNPIPCKPNCPKRSALCHGKYPDGTWRCKDWEKFKAAEALRREQAKKSKLSNRMMSEYNYDRRAKRLHAEARKAK